MKHRSMLFHHDDTAEIMATTKSFSYDSAHFGCRQELVLIPFDILW